MKIINVINDKLKQFEELFSPSCISYVQGKLLKFTKMAFILSIVCFIVNFTVNALIDNKIVISNIAEENITEFSSNLFYENAVNEKNNIDDSKNEEEQQPFNFTGIYSAMKSIVLLLGLSNVFLTSSITSNSKFKYGYIIEDVIKNNFKYKHWYIFVYLSLIILDYVYIELNLLFASLFLTLTILLFFTNYCIIYYYCIADDDSFKEFIIKDIETKIANYKCNLLNDSSSNSFKKLLNSLQGIISYVVDKHDNKQWEKKELAYECIKKVLEMEGNNKAICRLYKYTADDYDQILKEDIALMLYEILTILWKNCAVTNSDSKLNILYCITELIENVDKDETSLQQKECLYTAISLWLFFNVDYKTVHKLLNYFVMHKKLDLGNKYQKIFIYYLYANISLFMYDNKTYNEQYRELKSWLLKNQAARIMIADITNETDILENINENLWIFKARLLVFRAVDKTFLFSAFLPSLSKRLSALTVGRLRFDILSPLDEIVVGFDLII